MQWMLLKEDISMDACVR